MRHSILAVVCLFFVGALAHAQSAPLRMPARQVSVRTNDWTSLRPTNDNTQATFDWLDLHMVTDTQLTALSNSLAAADSNQWVAVTNLLGTNYWTIPAQTIFSNLVWASFPESGEYVVGVTNMGSSGTSAGVVALVAQGVYGIWFPSVASTGGTSTTSSTNTYNITFDCVAGTIQTFAMSNAPAGWLECNGAAVSSNDYPDLWAAIGTNYGGVAATAFNLPDYRGYFLRGWDHGAGVDPDAAARTGGDTVGSSQNDTNRTHTHATSVNLTSTNFASAPAGAVDYVYLYTNTSDGVVTTLTSTVASSGGSESRPVNKYVLWCIKTSNSTNSLGNLATTNWVAGNFMPGTNIIGATYNSTTLTWTVDATNYFGSPNYLRVEAARYDFANATPKATVACDGWTGSSYGNSSNWFNRTSGVFTPTVAGWYLITANLPWHQHGDFNMYSYLYKNGGYGSGYHNLMYGPSGGGDSQGCFASLLYFNGTTDACWLIIQGSEFDPGTMYAPDSDHGPATTASFQAVLVRPGL